MKKLFVFVLIGLFLAGLLFPLGAQEAYVPSPENLENRTWFQDAKFGLFIHWGVYSTMAGGGDEGIAEWIMNKKKIPISQYEKLPGFFNPVAFDPAVWVAMVKNAGMKYITITSKHHDGFAMYDSEVSAYNIVEKTPYAKDVLAMLKEECDRQGIRLFFYHSQLDWHHPDYYPRGRTGNDFTGRPESGDWDAYIDYMNTQLSELLTNYGEIGGIWFDGMWDKPDAEWRLRETYDLIHKLQPGALVGSNHHKLPYEGEDFMMFERDLPGQNSMGFNNTEITFEVPLEMCETMNGSWGFNLIDTSYKSVKQLIHTLVRSAGFGANFLLNTGPMPDGRIQPENVDTLRAMGEWMKVYGESIYGTRKAYEDPLVWGAVTSKGKTLYVHVLEPGDGILELPHPKGKVKSAVYFEDGSRVEVKKEKESLVMKLDKKKLRPVDTILVLTLK